MAETRLALLRGETIGFAVLSADYSTGFCYYDFFVNCCISPVWVDMFGIVMEQGKKNQSHLHSKHSIANNHNNTNSALKAIQQNLLWSLEKSWNEKKEKSRLSYDLYYVPSNT